MSCEECFQSIEASLQNFIELKIALFEGFAHRVGKPSGCTNVDLIFNIVFIWVEFG